VVGKAGRELLCLGFETADGARVNDAVTITLEGIPIGVVGLRKAAPQAALHREAKAGQHNSRAYWTGWSPNAPRAAWLTGPVCARSGSSSFFASAGLVGAMHLASSMVACSLETSAVG